MKTNYLEFRIFILLLNKCSADIEKYHIDLEQSYSEFKELILLDSCNNLITQYGHYQYLKFEFKAIRQDLADSAKKKPRG